MKEQRDCRWYVWARDAKTNEVLGRELSADKTYEGALCADGVRRDLWECSYGFVAQLIRSKATFQLDFLVFNQEGQNGKIRQWVFGQKKVSKKVAKAIAAKNK